MSAEPSGLYVLLFPTAFVCFVSFQLPIEAQSQTFEEAEPLTLWDSLVKRLLSYFVSNGSVFENIAPYPH